MIHVGSNFLTREISKQFLRNFSVSRSTYDTHYEVLQLPRNCTQKDIKNAFIKLSKQYHPDKSADASTHNKFVRLNEAYTTLSRPDSRREYDMSLVPDSYSFRSSRRFFYDNDFADDRPNPRGEYDVSLVPDSYSSRSSRRFFYDNDFADDRPNPRAFRDSSFWMHRDFSRDKENLRKPYYGIQGVKKMSNSWILTFLLLFSLFGVGLQVLLIRKSIVFSRKAMDQESARNSQVYKEIRARASEEGSDDKFLQHLLKSSQKTSVVSEFQSAND